MDPAGWAVVAGLVLVVLAVDRVLVRRAPGARGRRRRRTHGGSGGPGIGDLLEVFQPTLRHHHEEEQRQRHDLVQPGDADPDWHVDLDAGTVRRRADPD